LKTQCLELARAILAKWPESSFAPLHPKESGTGDLLKSLTALDDPTLIRQFLGDVLVKDAAVDPGKSIAAIGQTYGWGTFQQELLTVMKSTTIETIERNVRLLEPICLAKPRKKAGWGELCTGLAHELVSAIAKIDQE